LEVFWEKFLKLLENSSVNEKNGWFFEDLEKKWKKCD